MRDIQDNELLQSFVCEASQKAFTSLTRRYAGLLFHVTMRCSGSVELGLVRGAGFPAIRAGGEEFGHAEDKLWLWRTMLPQLQGLWKPKAVSSCVVIFHIKPPPME